MKKNGEEIVGTITITVKNFQDVSVRTKGIKSRQGLICLLNQIASQLRTQLKIDIDQSSFDEIYNSHSQPSENVG